MYVTTSEISDYSTFHLQLVRLDIFFHRILLFRSLNRYNYIKDKGHLGIRGTPVLGAEGTVRFEFYMTDLL